MKHKLFTSTLGLAFLSMVLPLSAEDANERQIYLSEVEVQEIFNNPRRSYVYIGKEVSEIAQVIDEISKLEDNQESPIWGLKNHIARGFSIGNYDAVAQALEQADLVLRNNIDRLDAEKARNLSQSLDAIINNVIDDKLSLNAELLSFLKDQVDVSGMDTTRAGLRLLVVNEKMNIHGRVHFYEDAIFYDDVKFKDDVVFKDEVTFEDNVLFEGNVTIEGVLSATDIFISGTLSVNDEIINCDLTVGCNISMNDSLSPAIGNIVKNGTTFIQNFGVNNTFMGDNAGNFTLTGTDNTALGINALSNLTTGSRNVAVGNNALLADNTGNENVAIGFNALAAHIVNGAVAVGTRALQNNTTGINNTAVGQNALSANTVGVQNTALGLNALLSNTIGSNNVAVGPGALASNTTGAESIAIGAFALQLSTVSNNIGIGSLTLFNNTTGLDNTSVGTRSLTANTIGNNNTALGARALNGNTTGNDNTALGHNSLISLTTGSTNIAIGSGSGATLTTGSGNIYINANAAAAAEATTIRIGTAQTRAFMAGIRGVTTGIANAIPVLIDSAGQLGTVSSTRRVKHNIKDMGNDSAAIYKLRPVTFAYNGDTSETKQYGLIAEEASEVFPEIVVVDENGQPFTVQYHVLPALLLNEFKKLAARVAALESRRN